MDADQEVATESEPEGKESSNQQKARLRVAKACAKVADKRLDHLHKLSTRLIRENHAVMLEDLNVTGMAKNHKLARAIAGAEWRLQWTLLESKTRVYGLWPPGQDHQPMGANASNLLSLWTPGTGRRTCPSVPGGVQPAALSTTET